MSIRLHALGFPASWTPNTARLLESIAEHRTRTVTAARGRYRLWRTHDGAELWFHEPSTGEARRAAARNDPPAPGDKIVAVTPFHRGLSACRVRVGRILTLDRSNPLEGSCLAWLPPASAGGREQVIVLELAPFGLHRLMPVPFTTTAQILCCAHAVWAYPNAAAYNALTPSNRRIQAGAYLPVSETDVPEVKLSYRHSPVTLGLATGTITRTIRHMNPITGEPYYWLSLETRRGTFDVIASPNVVAGDISTGHVAQVCGSFLARLDGAGT